jgi:broad specificity phosphatase PhoE
MEITLIKHARTDFNEVGKRQGSTDLSLNDRGKKEAAQLREELTDIPFDIVFSSPLKRAVETAQILFPSINIIKNDLLREYDFGELEGVRFSEPSENFPENQVQEYNGKQFLIPNQGESFEHVVFRVERFIQMLRHGFGGQSKIAIVTHSTIIEIFKALAEQKDWSAYLGDSRQFHGFVKVMM